MRFQRLRQRAVRGHARDTAARGPELHPLPALSLFLRNSCDVSDVVTVQTEMLEEFSRCFMRKLWWLEMVNFIEVLEGIGCFGFWDVGVHVHINLERIWH